MDGLGNAGARRAADDRARGGGRPTPPSGPLSTRLWEQGRAGFNPALAGRVGAYRRVLSGLPATASTHRVAVIASEPGAGASTVVALLALLASGFTAHRVVVVDTTVDPAESGRNGTGPGGPGAGTPDPVRRHPRVAELLGGSGEGRLPLLLEGAEGEPVARSRVAAASVTGTVVPVLAVPFGAGFPPELLTGAVDRLWQRAGLVLIDTPGDLGAPVFQAVLQRVDHVVLVVPADRSAPQGLARARDRLAAVPGPARSHQISVVLMGRTFTATRWRPDLPCTLVRRDAALARGLPSRPGPRTVIAGLELLGRISRPSVR